MKNKISTLFSIYMLHGVGQELEHVTGYAQSTTGLRGGSLTFINQRRLLVAPTPAQT